MFFRPNVSKRVFNVIANQEGETQQAVVPEAEDGRVRFVAVNNYLELRFKEAVHWRDDNMEGEDDEIIFLSSPLEIVFRADLNRSGVSKGGGDNRFIVCNVEELGRSEAFILKGSQLSIGPPVLVPRHYLQESGRIGGEGASSKLRGDY